MMVAISWVRDEADIIAESVSHMAAQVDLVVVMDHGSTDGTRDILTDLSGPLPLVVLDDRDPGFHQAAAMNRLVMFAREHFRAEWVIPFDGDELWDIPERTGDTIRVPMFDYVPLRDAPLEWRRPERQSYKVMFRWARERQLVMGNHHVTNPGDCSTGGMIRHFPNRSVEQFERKVRRGAAGYEGVGYGGHWARMLDDIETRGAEAVFEHFVADSTDGLVFDQPQSMRNRAEMDPLVVNAPRAIRHVRAKSPKSES